MKCGKCKVDAEMVPSSNPKDPIDTYICMKCGAKGTVNFHGRPVAGCG